MTRLFLERLLVAVDFSSNAQLAVDQAVAVAKQRGDAEITLLWVHDPNRTPLPGALTGDLMDEPSAATADHPSDTTETLEVRRARRRLDEVADRVRSCGVPVTVRVAHGYPDKEIVAAAAQIGATLVALGTRGSTGFARLLLGSVAEKVVRTCANHVLVARGQARQFERILAASDFSPASEHALQVALALSAPDARVDILHAAQIPNASRIDRLGDALVRRYADRRRRVTFASVSGSPASIIDARLRACAYDLVAMGTHGHRGMRRFLLGSVAEATVRHAPCSVLVARDLSADGS